MNDTTLLKWVPVIDHDACTGCGLCAEACDRNCIRMIWDFATLVRPEVCGSCGGCAEACEHGVIRMGWVRVAGADHSIGTWSQAVLLSNVPRQRTVFGFFRRRN